MKKEIDWNKIITERNKEWDAADRTEKKMLICKDVLEVLNTPAVKIKKGHYSMNQTDGFIKKYGCDDGNKELQKDLLEGNVECSVCARGAMMLSRFRFTNPNARTIQGASQHDTSRVLGEAFSYEELNMIENVFEDENRFYHGWLPHKFETILRNFNRSDNSKRLREIMERIILTKGNVEKALTCDRLGKPPLK